MIKGRMLTHLELFSHFNRSTRPWGCNIRHWKNNHFYACKKVVTRSGQTEEQRAAALENNTNLVDAVDCQACLVALDKLLSNGSVKITKSIPRQVMFTGPASKHRHKTMTEHYKTLAGKSS